jgi:Predicted membrane protein
VMAGSGATGAADIRAFYGDLALGKPADTVLHEVQCNRIWEIDLFRTLAILLMVIFHLVFDLNNYAGLKIDYMSGFWYWEGKVSALIFIFLAGVSSGFSRNTIKRGIKVLVFAMVITAATYIFYKEQYIQFGVLHFLGTCMFLYPLLKKVNNKALFILAIASALAAIPAKSIMAGTRLFIPVGIRYNGFATLDYYPLLPYISVFMLGTITYKLFYYKKQSLFKFNYENKYISTISRNSLAIYLIHQPVIIAVIFAFKIAF